MSDKQALHLRLSPDIVKKLDALVKTGYYSNKNEIIRQAIRLTLLKYKEIKK